MTEACTSSPSDMPAHVWAAINRITPILKLVAIWARRASEVKTEVSCRVAALASGCWAIRAMATEEPLSA